MRDAKTGKRFDFDTNPRGESTCHQIEVDRSGNASDAHGSPGALPMPLGSVWMTRYNASL
jgi:hypothetical protein